MSQNSVSRQEGQIISSTNKNGEGMELHMESGLFVGSMSRCIWIMFKMLTHWARKTAPGAETAGVCY